MNPQTRDAHFDTFPATIYVRKCLMDTVRMHGVMKAKKIEVSTLTRFNARVYVRPKV